MAIDDYDFTPEDVKSRLHDLFEAANAKDEFEFGCTLLRVRGMESAGWDPFGETHQLVEDPMPSSVPRSCRTRRSAWGCCCTAISPRWARSMTCSPT